MAHVDVDQEACISSGNCIDVAPQVFDMDDAGRVLILTPEVAEADVADAQSAAAVCPVRAIILGVSTASA